MNLSIYFLFFFFSYRMFCKMAATLCQKWFSKSSFLFIKKLKFLFILDHTIWFKSKDFRLLVPAFGAIAWNSFNGKFIAKLIFWSDILCYRNHYWSWQWNSKIFHTLSDKYFDHMLVKLEQYRIIRNVQKILAFWQKKWSTSF